MPPIRSQCYCYATAVSAVPTLSQWNLALLGILLAGLAMWRGRALAWLEGVPARCRSVIPFPTGFADRAARSHPVPPSGLGLS